MQFYVHSSSIGHPGAVDAYVHCTMAARPAHVETPQPCTDSPDDDDSLGRARFHNPSQEVTAMHDEQDIIGGLGEAAATPGAGLDSEAVRPLAVARRTRRRWVWGASGLRLLVIAGDTALCFAKTDARPTQPRHTATANMAPACWQSPHVGISAGKSNTTATTGTPLTLRFTYTVESGVVLESGSVVISGPMNHSVPVSTPQDVPRRVATRIVPSAATAGSQIDVTFIPHQRGSYRMFYFQKFAAPDPCTGASVNQIHGAQTSGTLTVR